MTDTDMQSLTHVQGRLYEWLRAWLLPVPVENREKERVYMQDGHVYQLTAWFQIAFTIYSVFYDQTANNYMWYASVNYVVYDLEFIQSPRFATQDDLLRFIARKGTWTLR